MVIRLPAAERCLSPVESDENSWRQKEQFYIYLTQRKIPRKSIGPFSRCYTHTDKHDRNNSSIIATLYCERAGDEGTVFNYAHVIPGNDAEKSKRNIMNFSLRAVVQRNLPAFSECHQSQYSVAAVFNATQRTAL